MLHATHFYCKTNFHTKVVFKTKIKLNNFRNMKNKKEIQEHQNYVLMHCRYFKACP